MGICSQELRQYVIRPTLQYLGVWSPAAENLLLGTAAQESESGFHLKQGRGFGIFQIDEQSHNDVWDKFLAFNPELASKVRGLASQREFLQEPHAELATNLSYATAIAWMLYQYNGLKLPCVADDVDGLAMCWYRYYPRHNIMATGADFVRHYREFIAAEKAAAA